MSEIVHANLEKAKTEENLSKEESKDEQEEEDEAEDKRGLKRKLDSKDCSEDQEEEDSQKAKGKSPNELERIKKAKNVGNLFCVFTSILACNDFEVDGSMLLCFSSWQCPWQRRQLTWLES